MNLIKLKGIIRVYGDTSYRGQCKLEVAEQQGFFAWLKEYHPDYYTIACHPKNEGVRTWGQAAFDNAMGSLNNGASDVIIPTSVSFVCEIKRQDHTKSSITDDQITYLKTSKKKGAFSCVALARNGAISAFNHWLELTGQTTKK